MITGRDHPAPFFAETGRRFGPEEHGSGAGKTARYFKREDECQVRGVLESLDKQESSSL
ncbi:hypothetical protein B4099_1468 [Heyndrickxia coagulans]|uniref:Uncharacterized protein n=1 Tax=Heyndrickxia coagulans TaxID=1398 RepID=A0A150KHY1_HEYCO|nr:hypothetical protein B4099_1468 [Heyndrickxia coagulans]